MKDFTSQVTIRESSETLNYRRAQFRYGLAVAGPIGQAALFRGPPHLSAADKLVGIALLMGRVPPR